MIERHAAVEADIEQLVHRQLAARVGEADDHAIDVQRETSSGMSSMRADDAGIQHRRAQTRTDPDR